MRLLALATLATLAIGAWLNVRAKPRTGGLMPLGVTWEPQGGCVFPDPADGVQSDPWPSLVRDNVVYDPTYLEATTLAAIRRSGQSSEVSTGGM